MSLFVEVHDVEKKCPVIINMDMVAEIAPLSAGGCAIFFADSAGSGAKSSIKVSDTYEQFQQFVMKTVSAEDIAKQVKSIKGKVSSSEKLDMEIPKL